MDVLTIDIGDRVLCDWMCGEEWTDRPESGGFLFQSKAICPDCAAKAEASIRGYGEQHLIRGRCPQDMSFADWVRSLR